MKIGVCTAFSAMMDFYSLTSVVLSQVRMIIDSGHVCALLVMDDFGWANMPDWAKEGVETGKIEIRAALPNYHKIDYMSLDSVSQEHKDLANGRMSEALENSVKDLDAVFTHDLIFTGWNLPIALAINNVAKRVTVPWLHWIHSVPAGHRDYWHLPERSVLVYPNAVDRVRCAENFRTWPENVVTIPHVFDLRDFAMTSRIAKKIITDFDVLGADLIQVYPIPTDRLEAKGVPWIIKMMGCFKGLGQKVKLVVPNAWCTIPEWRQKVDQMYQLAYSCGLDDSEVIFTSKVIPEREVGLPGSDIRDLALAGNIFICPTISETFGLSLAEAAAMGSLLVLNEDLPMLREVCGGYTNAIWARFSSNFYHTVHKDEARYLSDICRIVLHQIEHNPQFKSKNFYRQSYRREAVWSQLDNTIRAIKAGTRRLNA